MAASQVRDFADIINRVMMALKLDLSDTRNKNAIKQIINEVYLNEVVPAKNWKWLVGHVDKTLSPFEGTGRTASVTPDSTTVTLSSTIATSVAGYNFATDTFTEVYEVESHTAGSDTLVLKSPYTGVLNAAAAFKVWTDKVALPTDCRETIEVWHDFVREPLKPLGIQDFRRQVAQGNRSEGRPSFYNLTEFEGDEEETRYRIMRIYPSICSYSTTLHVDYIKEAPALELDGDEPLLPISDRSILVNGALAIAWSEIGRNPEEAARNQIKFDRQLARMVGKMEDSLDKPQVEPNAAYLQRKRGRQIKVSNRSGAGAFGNGGGSASTPSYLKDVVIDGAEIRDDVTVALGVTIDGRDISSDGATLDSHIAATTDAHDASAISVVASGNLASTDVQTALVELQDSIDLLAPSSALADHLADTEAAHAASAIAVTPAGNLAATDAQAALEELQSDIDDLTAADIANTPAGNLAATDVQGALNELQSDIDSRALDSALSDHISDTADAHAASAIGNTPAGNLAATDVQGALNELQTDVDGRIAHSTATTKGDILVRNSSSVTRLGVGTDGYILTADSAETTGVKWAAAPSAPDVPTVQKFTSGSGTYTTPANCRWIRVRMAGGGGGGGGSSTGSGGAGTGGNGGSTTFGTSLLTASGGTGAGNVGQSNGPSPGAGTINSPAIGHTQSGGRGGGNALIPTGGDFPGGGGGVSIFGSVGGGVAVGIGAPANSGGGGGGAGFSGNGYTGAGGSAGGYVDAIITSPSSSYSYSVGTGGSGGTAGTSGNAGGAGGSGIIVVEEYY